MSSLCFPLQRVVEEFESLCLYAFAAGVGHFPYLCYEFVVGSLAPPYAVHYVEGVLYAVDGEQLVLCSVEYEY